MVDFEQKIKNSDKFRPAAIHFEKHGEYCLFPEGTTEYDNYWDQEEDRSLNGYTAPDGDWISGYNYFYLNYCPILRIVDEEYTDRFGKTRKRRVRDRAFPSFYDYDYYYYLYIQECEDKGMHGIVLKARGKGYSFKGGSMLCRNYFLIPGSKSYAVASENEYLTKDGLLTKAWEFMDFIDKHTAWAKKRSIDRTMHKRAGVTITDENGNKTEQGYLSEIIGISLKNNPDRIRGKRGKLILWEEAGMFKDILQAWQIARPGVEADDVAFGTMIAYGTGGSEGDDFRGLRELFYNPSGYNVNSVPNIWDDNVADNNCGFFVPAWSNMINQDEEGNRMYMDFEGNSLPQALDFVYSERQKVIDGATDSNAIDRYIAERPICPQEACLEISGNIFPKKELQQQLAMIRSNKKLQSHKQVGDLIWVNGELQWQQKKHGDITNYPLKRDQDPTGAIVIWEHPVKDAPIGLYIAGCLTPGEKVLTDVGLLNVEDVPIGAKLISKDGTYVNIINHQQYYKENIDTYTIQPYGSYRTTTFTEEHPILIGNDFIKCKDLQVNDTLKIPNIYNNSNEDYLEVLNKYNIKYRDAIKLFWFFGLWLGDGFTNINRNSYDIYMSFGSKQEIESAYYSDAVKHIFDRSCITTSNGNTKRFTNKNLVGLLNAEFGKYAISKQIPEWIKFAPLELKISFIQGYLDADGSVFLDRGKQQISFTSVNLQLLESLQDMLYGLHIANSITLHSKSSTCVFNNKKYNTLESYKLKISRNSIGYVKELSIDIGWKIHKLIEEPYKENKYIKFIGNYIYLPIKKIDHKKYTGYVYNFECETHSYMSRCIVTHNCDPLNQAVLL